MGVRSYSEAAKLAKRQSGLLSSNYALQVLYDGVDTVGSGKQANLAGNEMWVDATGLYRLGLNIGPTFQNLGPTSCEIFGSLSPKDYAQLIDTQASLATIMATRWKTLGVLAPGAAYNASNLIFSLFRFVFVSGTHGEVAVATL